MCQTAPLDKTGARNILRGGKGVCRGRGGGGAGEEAGFSVPHARPAGLTTKIREYQMMGSGALDMACSMFHLQT